MYNRSEIVTLARAYLAAKEITAAALSREVMGPHNSKLFDGLFAGGDILMSSAEKASKWFDANWPIGVLWPLARRERLRNVTALRRLG